MKIKYVPHSLEYMPIYLKDKNAFLHYTCNSISNEKLNIYNITKLGFKFGCKNDKEVLLIPRDLYLKNFSNESNDILKLNLELLLKNIK